MDKIKEKQFKKQQRKKRIRIKISGTAETPRISVFRSLAHISAQLIDDSKGLTLVSVSDKEIKEAKNKTEKAFALGKVLAEKAVAKKITQAVFDKGSYKYHGRIKALADGAREGGLKF